MDKSDTDLLGQRIDRLERENRRLLWILLASFVGSLVFLIEAAPRLNRSRTIEAKALVLRDKAGTVRAKLAVNADGTPELAMFDSKGRYQFAATAQSDENAFLSFFHRGEMRAILQTNALGSSGTSSLTFMNEKGNEVSTIYLSDDNRTGLSLNNGKQSVHLAVKPEAAPRLCVSDGDASECDEIRVNREGTLRLLAP